MCNEYNGYSNYQTWCVSLWLDNDEGTYESIRDAAKIAFSKYELAIFIREYVEAERPLADQASMFTDLLNHALTNVNYEEIASPLFETVR